MILVPVVAIMGAWLTFSAVWVLSSFFVKREMRSRSRASVLGMRVVLVGVLLVLLGSIAKLGTYGSHLAATPGQTGIAAWLGAALTWLGIGYAIWARVHLGTNWSPVPSMKENHELITTGPYRYVRHPIYTGILVAVLGNVLLASVWVFGWLLIALMFMARIRTEESYMRQLFPDTYPDYVRHSWALIPYLY